MFVELEQSIDKARKNFTLKETIEEYRNNFDKKYFLVLNILKTLKDENNLILEKSK